MRAVKIPSMIIKKTNNFMLSAARQSLERLPARHLIISLEIHQTIRRAPAATFRPQGQPDTGD
jgi:hypothetical protein